MDSVPTWRYALDASVVYAGGSFLERVIVTPLESARLQIGAQSKRGLVGGGGASLHVHWLRVRVCVCGARRLRRAARKKDVGRRPGG